MAVKLGGAVRRLRDSFRQIVTLMQKMHGTTQVYPGDTEAIHPIDTRDRRVRVECRPVVINLPERASMSAANLFIVFTGWIDIAQDERDGQMLTAGYATNFGYFKVARSAVTHALGGHYDFAPTSAAHPRAHMQLRSQLEMWGHATARFHSVRDLPMNSDPMSDLLDRVRTPSAQMDFLSFAVQVAADHLVDGQSGKDVRENFNRLVGSCAPLLGYAADLDDPCSCHRSMHWYRPANVTA